MQYLLFISLMDIQVCVGVIHFRERWSFASYFNYTTPIQNIRITKENIDLSYKIIIYVIEKIIGVNEKVIKCTQKRFDVLYIVPSS